MHANRINGEPSCRACSRRLNEDQLNSIYRIGNRLPKTTHIPRAIASSMPLQTPSSPRNCRCLIHHDKPRAFCPGFLRGLAFHNGHAIVGLSQPHDCTSSGLQIDEELKKRDADPWCGVQIVNLASGDIVESLNVGIRDRIFRVGPRRVILASVNDRLRSKLAMHRPDE
jgi:hypothetical protein